MSEELKYPTVKWWGKDVPAILYKYRSWDDIYQKKIITHLQIKVSAPKEFKDIKDCRNIIRYDLLTDDQIVQKYFIDSQTRNPHYTIEQHYDNANRCAINSPLQDKAGIIKQQVEDFERYNLRIGIFSLCLYPNLIRMWSEYANENKGFCVGFRSEILFKYLGGGGAVIYCKNLPTIMPTPWHSRDDQYTMQVHHKTEQYRFEEEYRTTTFSGVNLTDETRLRILPPECYKEIIFGTDIDPIVKEQIMKEAKKNIPHIQFREARFVEGVMEIG